MRDSGTEMPGVLHTIKNLQTLYGELEEWIKENDLGDRIGVKDDAHSWIVDITGRNKAQWCKVGKHQTIKISDTSLQILSKKGLFGDTKNGELLRVKLLEIARMRLGRKIKSRSRRERG